MSLLMSPEIRSEVESCLKSRLVAIRRASGGDINDAYLITLADGRRLFVKTNRAAPPMMFEREAEGLELLRTAAGTHLAVPEVLALGSRFLILQCLEVTPASAAQEARLGRGLAEMHRAEAPRPERVLSNFIGTLKQDNTPSGTFVEFYRERRLRAQMELPGAKRLLGTVLTRRLGRVLARLEELLPQPEPLSLVHGDLWAGNWLSTTSGPALIDPAVYLGHREADLAMMRLFGGFGEQVFEAYSEVFPLAPGAKERVQLFQLYPLLVHVNLFGESYLPQLSDAVNAYV